MPLLRKCPFDNKSFPLTHNSLESFPLNFALLAFLEVKQNDECKVHPGQKLKVICFTDQRKLCSECVKSEQHNGHTMKKVKELKAQGAKVKGELESTLSQIKDYEKTKENDCETIRKKLISTIDEQFKEIKEIIVDKHFEAINHANNLFNIAKQKGPERTFVFKQQIDETIKDITHACADNGDLLVLEKAFYNNQSVSKMLPQFLKEKSEEMHNKFLKMQKSFAESLENSRRTISALQLPSQEVVKELYSVQEGRQKLSERELSKIYQECRTLKFFSYFDVKKTSEGLEISMWPYEPKQIEVNDGDFKSVEAIDIKLGRYDLLMKELMPNILTYIFRSGLEKLTSLEVSFDSKEFNRNSVAWLANIVSRSVQSLKSLSLDLEKCNVHDQPLGSLCNLVFSKMKNLKDFYLYLNSSQVNNSDLQNLLNSIKPFQKNFECFALGLADNNFTDTEIFQVFQVIQSMDGLKNLQLILWGTKITDRSLEVLGENLLPRLKALDSFTLSVSKCQISDRGVLSIFKNLRGLKKLELYLSNTQITDKTVDELTREVKRRLESLKSLTFIAKNTQVSKKDLWEIRDTSMLLKKEEH